MTTTILTPEQFFRLAAYFAIILGAILLIYRTAIIRRRMGWGFSRSIGAVLTDGMLVFGLLVVFVCVISALRYFSVPPFAGDAGQPRASWVFLGALVFSIWVGYFRLEFWYTYGSAQDAPEMQQANLQAELRATRSSIERMLARVEIDQRPEGGS